MTVHTTPSAAVQTALPAAALEGVLPGRPAVATRKKLSLRKLLLMGAAVIAVAGASWYGYDYWTVGQYLVSTDDAYVKADNTTVAPKVGGYLDRVLVADNEQVKAGQVLARIDDRDFRVALDQAKADVLAANATISSKEAQIEVQQAVIVRTAKEIRRARRRSKLPGSGRSNPEKRPAQRRARRPRPSARR